MEQPEPARSDYYLARSLQHHLEGERYDHLESNPRAFFAYRSPEFYGLLELCRKVVDVDGDCFVEQQSVIEKLCCLELLPFYGTCRTRPTI